MDGRNTILYVGKYCDPSDEGISIYALDEETPQLNYLSGIRGLPNPTYLVLSSDRRYLYAVLETMTFEGEKAGAVAAFSLTGNPQNPSLLNTMATGGTGSCHLAVDQENHFLFTADYMGGSISMLELAPDGSVARLCDCVKHSGKGPNQARQEAPHPHFVSISPDGNWLWAVDLGIDRIKCYQIDRKNKKLIADAAQDLRFSEGTGIRHFVRHPENNEILYTVCELTSEVVMTEMYADQAQVVQTISALPKDVPENISAAIKLLPNGRFLYVSNRGDDSVSVFAVDPVTKKLSRVQTISTGGKAPRDFLLCKNLAIVANQDSNALCLFQIDQATGELIPVAEKTEESKPVCVISF